MKKILIAIIIVVTLAFFSGVFYLKETILPAKIKETIVHNLETTTKKRVNIGSVRLNIFKGLILNDLIISDDQAAIINVKEAHCHFFILPLLAKKIIISRLTLNSPDIFIERRKDSSFNILELFPKDHMTASGFRPFIRRVIIKKATVNFHDLTFDPPLAKEIKDFDADVYLLLPAKMKFNMKLIMPSDPPTGINCSGEWLVASKQLTAEIRVKDFEPAEFFRYYENLGLSIPEGRLDALVNLKHDDNSLSFDAELETASLAFSKNKLLFNFNGSGRFNARYDFTEKKFDYTGDANIRNMSIAGVEYLERVDDIKGRIEFSNLGLSSDNMTATIFGLPVEGKIKVDDIKNPALDMDISADIALANFQDILKEKFDLKIPAEFSGDGKLKLMMRYAIAPELPAFQIKGSLYMLNASVTLNKGSDILKNVTGKFEFLPNQISWDDVGFSYRTVHYSSSGTLTNFVSPGIQLKLASKDISVDSAFALNEKKATFSRLTGKYLNSSFSGDGTLDASDPAKFNAEISAIFDINSIDLKSVFPTLKEKIERAKPKGTIRAELSLKGNPKDIKSCAIDAKLSSDELSLYGFNFASLTLNYSQKNGAGDILFMRSFVYGGSLGLTGKIEWSTPGVPYQIDADMDGVKIEKLKNDINLKDKDIAGTVKMHVKLKGLSNDISKLSGEGKVTATQGKLWQLNLFRGLGTLLFTTDFSNIIFKECYANFDIRDKAIFSDEVNLKSKLLDIYGPVRIGFDGAVSGTIKAEFSEDAIDSGLRKNIAATLGNYTVVALEGTVKEPKYNIRLDAAKIVESVAENLSGQ